MDPALLATLLSRGKPNLLDGAQLRESTRMLSESLHHRTGQLEDLEERGGDDCRGGRVPRVVVVDRRIEVRVGHVVVGQVAVEVSACRGCMTKEASSNISHDRQTFGNTPTNGSRTSCALGEIAPFIAFRPDPM